MQSGHEYGESYRNIHIRYHLFYAGMLHISGGLAIDRDKYRVICRKAFIKKGFTSELALSYLDKHIATEMCNKLERKELRTLFYKRLKEEYHYPIPDLVRYFPKFIQKLLKESKGLVNEIIQTEKERLIPLYMEENKHFLEAEKIQQRAQKCVSLVGILARLTACGFVAWTTYAVPQFFYSTIFFQED